ncbi:hypothetical protein [Natrinema ejinorense]|uniref:PD(D/E)XK endonuclease domain-containing protein n=1 Tax=Natrinema ejinorense TaxID=373386 RepID=A0A2A5QWR5_9EURY|nr:hypothetical protein [Natrinema ejinorense]PCR91255.1 hypothetical protein CP557_12400 [Natrinema ejinorense]
MPSHKSNKFGTAVEKRVVDEYRLELSRSPWHDALMQNGKPVEIKSTRLEHADGGSGNFKIYEKYHRKLRRHDGYYVFGVYKSSPFKILKLKRKHSSQIPRLSWHGGGDHRGTQQAKLAIDRVF